MRQNKFTKIQFDIADDGITNRSTIGGKACVFEPVQNTFKNRNLIGKLKTLQTASVQSLSKNFKNLIQKLNLSEFLRQTLGEKAGIHSPPKTLTTIPPNQLTTRSQLTSLTMLLTFVVVFVIPLTIFEELHAQSVPTLGSSKQ
ncbi:hypothetical protein Q4558_14855, partial [Leptospira santarosai]|nr:hypothetical protein [Leptospira santarosai]MDO6398872.1 hypothetical protein [Leptospira santarosai]